jgi:hypothetical protein
VQSVIKVLDAGWARPSPIPDKVEVIRIIGNTNPLYRKKDSLSRFFDFIAGIISEATNTLQSTDPNAIVLALPTFSIIKIETRLPKACPKYKIALL